ncbi:MAG: bifunctional ADP-dependent NAD(P)H-hydrate dehydratase/NAD(P)H-hydrate epimerase [Desulfuromonas sp.]|nr:MAG: bifunctional ADP-dependent NAD(P)H-hydrate dehydratase/NAD(P)H-hydrate epimerase [Desulfuromonas sp.]
MNLLTAKQMRELDRTAIEEWGVPGLVLMENAGKATVDQIVENFAPFFPGPVTIFAGKGNNGGDGYVIARHLMNRGWEVALLVLAEPGQVGGDAGTNLDILVKSGADIEYAADIDAFDEQLDAYLETGLIVDALFGTGLSSEVEGIYAKAVDWINASSAPVVAVDIPSGIDATTGQVLGCAVLADLTVTFASAKVGQVVYPAVEFVGDLIVADIGIPKQLSDRLNIDHLFINAEAAQILLPARPARGHKGTFGHLLLLAGSTGKSGAAALAAEGGLRAGAGLATLACPEHLNPIFETKLTEVMTAPLPEVDGMISMQAIPDIEQLCADKSTLAIGPGLGTGREISSLVSHLVRECPLPMVIDADGLTALVDHLDQLKERQALTILTPHPGEMARMTGLSIAEVEADRLTVARDFATRYNVILVLKGARTVVAEPGGSVFVNGSGNPSLACGGTGDVLTGVIAGLLGQQISPVAAVLLGVYLHGRAADRLFETQGRAGILATDLLREIPATRRELLLEEEVC